MYSVFSDITDRYPIFAHYTISHPVKNGGPRPSRRRVPPANLARLSAS